MATATQNPWKTTIPEPSGNGEYTPCPAGNHPGRICGLFDVGHHPVDRSDQKTGQVKTVDVRQLVIVFELSKKQTTGQPFTMAVRYTFSMNEKATLYSFVKNVTGAVPRPGQEFDPTTLLGRPVMVTVIHKGNADGTKTYANIGAVAAWPEGFPEPTWTIPPIAWSVLESAPFPEAAWHPYIFGKSIKTLAGECKEARGYSTPASSAGSVIPPVAPATVVRSNITDYPPIIQPLMTKWSISPGFGVDDVNERVAVAGMPQSDADALLAYAIPF